MRGPVLNLSPSNVDDSHSLSSPATPPTFRPTPNLPDTPSFQFGGPGGIAGKGGGGNMGCRGGDASK